MCGTHPIARKSSETDNPGDSLTLPYDETVLDAATMVDIDLGPLRQFELTVYDNTRPEEIIARNEKADCTIE